MITRYHAPIKTKLRNSFLFSLVPLVTSAAFGTLAILVQVYSDGASFIWPFAVALLIIALLMFCWKFNPGRPHEAYVLADRTLAIVRTGRKTRFIKVQDLRAYYPFSGTLMLQDGARFACQSYDGAASRKELPLALIQRWYDDSHQEALKDATESYHSISGAGITTSILVITTAIATMGYAAVHHMDGLAFWGQLLFGGGMISVGLPTYLKRRRVIIRLRAEGERRPVNILRIPSAKPWLASLLMPYLLIALVLAGAFPLADFASHYAPPGPERTKAIAWIACTALLCALYLAWRFYQRVVRGDLYTTIIVSPRSLQIYHPSRPATRLRRKECIALRTADDAIIRLDDGVFQLGGLPDLAAHELAISALRRKWWAHVPDATWKARLGHTNSERPQQISLRPEDYTEAAVQSNCHT
jgi:hypothetical protein